jgi:peptidoglycan/LPS O-acetylase OafA/YrhL
MPLLYAIFTLMKSRLLELDVLRGIAAIGVVLAHFIKVNEPNRFDFNIGYVGIDLFFVISGFVIIWSASLIDARKFCLNRFSRIFPPYWFAVIFTTILFYLQNNTLIVPTEPYEPTNNLILKAMANLTMIQYYFRIENIDGQYWTMTVELFFYGCIFLLLLLRRLHKIEQYGVIALAFSTLYCFPLVNSFFLFHKIKAIFILIPYFPLFFAGILFYKLKFEAVTIKRIVFLFSTFVIQAFLFSTCYKNNNLVSLPVYLSLLCAIYIIFLLLVSNQLSFIVNTSSVWLGKISYSLYLIHGFLGKSILLPYFHETLLLSNSTAIIITITLLIGLSYFIYRFIEIPSLYYIRRILST